MRKLLLLAVSLLLTVTTIFAERVSQADAALVAKNFMSAPAVQTGIKKAVPTKMVLKKAASAEENQYYVYENANGEGWVMVAANDIAHPILAYSPTGQFRTDNQPKNLKVWLGGYDNQIKRAAADGVEACESIKQEWAALRKSPVIKTATPVVSPLIKTGWDQDAPYWNLCPKKSGTNCYTGCVATAMAQVMNYWQWPVKGTGSNSVEVSGTTYTVNFGNTTYDWANMLNTYSGSSTSAQKTAVATLMYHCGVACDMQYGTADEGGSGAYTIDYNGYWSGKGTMCAEKALTQFFGYNSETVIGYYRDGSDEDNMRSWTKAEWIAMLKTELDAKRPIMYAGAGCDDPNDESTCYGHSFVCDGYDSSNYFHFNWGWGNWCDGYYDVDAMETTDPGSGGGNGEYNLQQDVIVGIMPPGEDRNVTWMANGSLFTQTVASKGILTLPTSTPSACSNGKVFVGWTATQNYESATTAPTFVKAGDIIEADATYYAVFATKTEGGGTTIEKASSIAVGDKVILVYETDSKELSGISSTSTKYGLGQDYTDTPTGVFPLDVVQGKTTGTFALMNGSNYLSWTSGNSLTTTGSLTDNSSWNISFSSGDAVIKNSSDETRSIRWNSSSPRFACYTGGQNAVQLYKIGSGASYSNYSTSCGVPETKTLQSITLNTDNVKKAFTVGDAFSSTGLVVTATYKGDETSTITTADVTDFTVSTPDMTSAGEKTVTVSYTYGSVTKTATYTITVAEPQTYTISFYNNGQLIGTAQTVVEGDSPTVPANPTTECTDFSFVGWAKAEQTTETTTKPTLVSDFTATQDQNYYAIFSRTENSQSGGSSNFSGAGTYKIYADVSGTKYYLTGNANSSSKIESTTTESEAPEFTIAAVTGGYTIKTGDKYIKYNGSSTNVGVSTTAYTWTITASTAGFGSFRVGASTATTRALAFANNTYKTFGGYATSNINGSDYFDLEIVGNGSSSTTYYTSAPSCTPAVVCELTGITLNTSSVKKDFFVGDAFTSTGLVVTAAYSNCENKVVTPTNISTPDMSTAGTKQVTVSYTENEVTKTASYNITVNELPVVNTYTVTWHACDGNTAVTYNEGDPLVLPATPAANAGKAFYGWTTTEHYTGATAPAIISAGGAVNADADYYAVYE